MQGEGGGSQLSAAIGVSKEEEKTEGGPRTLKKKMNKRMPAVFLIKKFIHVHCVSKHITIKS